MMRARSSFTAHAGMASALAASMSAVSPHAAAPHVPAVTWIGASLARIHQTADRPAWKLARVNSFPTTDRVVHFGYARVSARIPPDPPFGAMLSRSPPRVAKQGHGGIPARIAIDSGDRDGLDPNRWTSSERRIRCPQ